MGVDSQITRAFSINAVPKNKQQIYRMANLNTRGVNHGTFLHVAHEEGLIKNTSIHAGIRAPLIRRKGDLRNDVRCGFDIITARAIDKIGADGIISQIKQRVGDSNVYISVDIDVLDPAYAPGRLPTKT